MTNDKAKKLLEAFKPNWFDVSRDILARIEKLVNQHPEIKKADTRKALHDFGIDPATWPKEDE